MPIVDFDPSTIVPLNVITAMQLEQHARERREADIAYTKLQAKMLFDDKGTGKLATLADGTAPQWGPGYGGRYEKPGDWAHMTPDEQSVAMERSLREWNEIMGVQPFLTKATAKTSVLKINTPSYDHRTNYCLADLAACGVEIVQVPSLNVLAQPQYLYPRYDDSGKVIGGAFFVRNA